MVNEKLIFVKKAKKAVKWIKKTLFVKGMSKMKTKKRKENETKTVKEKENP